jgi:hypothetical protein
MTCFTEQLLDPLDRIEVDVVPTAQEVLIREVDAKRFPQAGKVTHSVKFTSLVSLVRVVHAKLRRDRGWVASCVPGPRSKGSAEIDPDHHSAQVEHQGSNLGRVYRKMKSDLL